jgi:hypothetical protein
MPFALAKGWKTGASVGSVQCTCTVLHGGAQYKRMSKDFSRKFYSSQVWNNCRAAYMNSVNHLCERCLQNGLIVPAEIVHHKIELTPDNITNPDITLNFNNLEAVCRECHSDIHKRREKRFKIMEDGRVIAVEK